MQFVYVGAVWLVVGLFGLLAWAGVLDSLETLVVMFVVSLSLVAFMSFKFWRCER